MKLEIRKLEKYEAIKINLKKDKEIELGLMDTNWLLDLYKKSISSKL